MTIDEIREGITIALNSHSYDKLLDLLTDTNPGHYGAEDAEFSIDISDIWVDVPKRTFTYKNATISFGARLGSSREDDGADMDFSLTISGAGKFEFKGSSEVEILEISTDQQIDLFPPHDE